jgi:glycerate 2-kinase
MRVLIAPQEFKESLTATEAASAIAAGIHSVLPNWELDVLPMSDGGPGFVDALAEASPGERRTVATTDCLGAPVSAEILLLDHGRTTVIEAAQSNGLALIPPERRAPLTASTEGVGTMILAARGASRVIIGVGGSATSDGGSGAVRELGAQILSGGGESVGPGGAALRHAAAIRWARPDWLEAVGVTVATDVTNPLLGPNGGAHIYGPQKGATPTQVEELERGLACWAQLLESELGARVADLPGAGAAGGLTAGLVAFLDAEIRSGFDVVADATRLSERLAVADIVVTGEGSFDSQSATGKTTGKIIELAGRQGKRWVVLAGRSDTPNAAVRTLENIEPDPEKSMSEAAALLASLARSWASEMPEN